MQRRTNQEWLEELRGIGGATPQSLAYQDLGAYMYRVAYNYLLYRQAQPNPRILASFAPEELATLAKDFVQETQEKLVINDFALLDKFTGKGAFTSWVAKIVKTKSHKSCASPTGTDGFRSCQRDRSRMRNGRQLLS